MAEFAVANLTVRATEEASELDQVSLDLHDDEVVAVWGGPSSGKAALLRMLSGQVEPEGGLVTVNSEVVRDPTLLRTYVRSNLDEESLSSSDATVGDVLAGLHQRLAGWKAHTGSVKADLEELDHVAKPYYEVPWRQLASAVQSHFEVATLLAGKPWLVVLFDPPDNDESLWRVVRRREHSPVVVGVDNLTQLVRLQNSLDRVVLMGEGDVKWAGPADELLRNPQRIAAKYGFNFVDDDLNTPYTFGGTGYDPSAQVAVLDTGFQAKDASKDPQHADVAIITEHESEDARYVNVAITTMDGHVVPSDRGLELATQYLLRLDIGPLSPESIVTNAPEYPFVGLPPSKEGHWLELLVVSDDVRVLSKREHFFLPTRGLSWRCECRPGRRHRCSPHERSPYVQVSLRTRSRSLVATLRLGIYFRKNLVHSQLLSATIGTSPSPGAKLSSVIDYSLAAGMTGLERFPQRSVNIMVNDNGDGRHRIVVNGHTRYPLAFIRGPQQMELASKRARTSLFNAHLEIPENISQPQPKDLISKYKQDGSKGTTEFLADLRELASFGWELLTSIAPQSRDIARLKAIIREEAAKNASPITIQVARAVNSSLLYPWQLVYDIPPEDEPAQWKKMCPTLKAWLDRKNRTEPTTSLCPSAVNTRHDPGTLCMFGFWGFSAVLEVPPPHGPEQTLKTSISDHPVQPTRVVALGTDLPFADVTSTHLKELGASVGDGNTCSSNKELRQRLSSSDLDIIYFYCHGGYRAEAAGGTPELIPVLILGRRDRISPSLVTAWAVGWDEINPSHWDGRRPLVILNGCHTTELLPKDLLDFVSSFLGARAAGVIGTEITIDQRVATRAMKEFLQLFERGASVGSAMRSMRWSLLRQGNVMGLAYTPHCSANLQVWAGAAPEAISVAG